MYKHRNEELQEQLWAISIRDVRQHLSPETMERFGGSGQSLPADAATRTRRHSFRSTSVRVKSEDRERLIDTEDLTGREEFCNEGWMEGAEEEGEGE